MQTPMPTPSKARRLPRAWGRAALGALVLAALVLSLPSCTLDRRPIVPATFVYTCTASVRNAAGDVIDVEAGDLLLAGGTAAPTFSTFDGDLGGVPARERVLSQWRRYLQRRLADPLATPEFRARFGTGPFCVTTVEAVRTDVMRVATSAETGAEIATCTPLPPPGSCGNPAGVVPAIAVDMPAVDFGNVPVGAASADVALTIFNGGSGRLCLDAPLFDPARSPQLADFALDVSDCAPRSPEELSAGVAILQAGVRPACVVRVRLTPSDPGERRALLRATTPGSVVPAAEVPLVGQGLPGAVSPSSNPLCFNVPTVVVPGRGTCYPQRLSLSNMGPGSLTVRSIALPAAAMSAGWEIASISNALPTTLSPSGLLTVNLRACAVDPPDAVLTVLSNGSLSPFDVTLLRPASGCTP